MKLTQFCSWLLMAIIMAGCASITGNTPVISPNEKAKSVLTADSAAAKKSSRNKEWRPEVYVVQKGDTLYSIAFNYGFGYRELAELNGIKNPGAIAIGQTIRLFPNKSTTFVPPVTGVAVADAAESKPTEPLPKEQPKLVKYAYSAAAMELIDKVQQSPVTTASESPAPVLIPANNNASAVVAKDTGKSKPDANADNADDEKEEPALEWDMPTQGKLIAQFSESANRKGIDIAGKLGQPVLASAAGKVVYSGSGLRGYGKLIIIKHNATYLSAYAHNDKILVKEGQSVARGQKIAAMGSTDADKVKLHFEVRRLGKPVDPAKFLQLGKL
jgi:lipoprotein NlpD